MSSHLIDFYSSIISFKLFPFEEKTIIPAYVGHMFRGAVLALIEENDPKLSAALHHGNEIRPYALSNLYSPTNQTLFRKKGFLELTKKDCIAFNFKTINLKASKALLSSFLEMEQEKIFIAEKEFMIDSITVNTDHWTDQSLLVKPPPERFEVEFLTPTHFISIRTKNPYLFPDPLHFFGNLAKTSHKLNLFKVSFNFDEFMEFIGNFVYLQLYKLQTRIVKMGKLPLNVGFTGWTRYLITNSENNYVNLIPVLLKVGEILNVGKKRTAGMGVIRTEIMLKS